MTNNKNYNAKLTTYGLEKKQSELLPFLPEVATASYFAKSYDAVIGWGLKENTKKMRLKALKSKIPFLNLEDGFIRSVGLGTQGYPMHSLIVDYNGAYYNPRKKNDLQGLIKNSAAIDDKIKNERAENIIKFILENKITKYNTGKNISDTKIYLPSGKKVLLIDQTFNDCSVTLSSQGQKSFDEMFMHAQAFYPNTKIIIKTHPEVAAGIKSGYLQKYFTEKNVFIISEDIAPYDLFEQVEAVFTVSSLTGCEALFAGKKVYTFGMPFYAGYGLTFDCAKKHYSNRAFEAGSIGLSLPQLFHAAYIDYPRYLNPFTKQPTTIENTLDAIVDIKNKYQKNAGVFYCTGFRKWKRPQVLPFINNPFSKITFCNSQTSALKKAYENDAKIMVWAAKKTHEFENDCKQKQVPLINVEDGFFRSIGLGSNFVPASSLVFDELGIYYDSSKPSKLEEILKNATLTDAQIQRAENVKNLIVTHALTKYNLEFNSKELEIASGKKKVILVVGQVEDDASIKTSPSDIKSNLKLLQLVRQQNLSAYIIYRPHPDVSSGNREGEISEHYLSQLADISLPNVGISKLLDVASEVYTISSLVGFEALLRGKKVFTFGTPFYASYGLTHDYFNITRRRKNLTLLELVYATLIEYPQYFDRITKLPCEVEDILNSFINNHDKLKAIEEDQPKTRTMRYIKGLFTRL